MKITSGLAARTYSGLSGPQALAMWPAAMLVAPIWSSRRPHMPCQ